MYVCEHELILSVSKHAAAENHCVQEILSKFCLCCVSAIVTRLTPDLGAEAAKVKPKNIRAVASRISVEPKLQNV